MCWLLALIFSLSASDPPDADALARQSQQARTALLGGRYDEAISLYRQLVKTLPENTGLRLNLAVALDKAGQPTAAIPELLRVTREDPKSEPAWFLLGLAYQQLNQPERAITPLRRALQLQPQNADVLLELGDAELTTGAAREAIGRFSALVALRPEAPKGWEGLGRAYLSLSEQAFRSLQHQAPTSPYYRALAARSHNLETQGGESTPLLLEPKPDCRSHPAACAAAATDWQTALKYCEQTKSEECLYWTSLASSELAFQAFNKLATLPPSPESHAVLADAYQRMGRRMEAVEEWRQALALHPSDHLLQARLAESLIRARLYSEAERLLAPLVTQQPENADWQYLLGNALLQMQRDDEARHHLEAAVERAPALLPAQEALGRLYLNLDQPAKAIPHLEKALSLDDGSISFALSTAYRKLGRTEEARAALARYQSFKQSQDAGQRN